MKQLAENTPIRLSQVFMPQGLANAGQTQYYQQSVQSILEKTNKTNIALHCLYETQRTYDAGGISGGRAERSLLLDGTINHLENGQTKKAQSCLAILIAMYYSPEYIRSHWAGSLASLVTNNFPYAGLGEITQLTIAGLQLSIDELPDINHLNNQQIQELCRP